MKKNYSTIVLIFLMLMGTLILFNKKEASEFEMRKLKKYPELTKENIFDGSFGKEFEEALTDRVPGKIYFTSLNSYKDFLLGEREKNGVYLSLSRLTQKPIKNVLIEKLLMEKEKHPNLKAYLIPYKLYYENNMPLALKNLKISEEYQKRFDQIKDKSDVDFTKILTLENYYLGDHHLNSEGVKKVLQTLGFENEKETESFGKFIGGEARKSGIMIRDDFSIVYDEKTKDLKFKRIVDGKESEELVVDENRAGGVDKYLAYMGGNFGEVAMNGLGEKSLLILKDSFANPFIGFFAEKYGKIKIVDPRFFDGDIFKELENFDEIIVFSGI
ncbi:hypothetical protein [Ezakiella coagulans]|uniref:hypothetical protein n=1 Tax=Ezakiella coagulans TaxID=46507 RepID=UPI00288B3C5D|nr:hypothetical protein [Ezakiella coagulans]